MKIFKLCLIASILAIGLSADEGFRLPKSKGSIALMGGYSGNEPKDIKRFKDADNAWIGGVSFKYEERMKHKKVFYGFGADFLESSNMKVDGFKASYDSISLFGTLGYHFTKKISTNLYSGLSYNKLKFKEETLDDLEDGQAGFMYGASINYGVTGLVQEIMFRYTEPFKDEGLASKAVLYRIGVSF